MSDQQAEVETTYVKTHPDEGDRVGLAERDPAHPKTDDFPEGGECYVAGQDQEPQLVAKTAGVMQALARKRLVEVSAPRRRAAAPAETPASEGGSSAGSSSTQGSRDAGSTTTGRRSSS